MVCDYPSPFMGRRQGELVGAGAQALGFTERNALLYPAPGLHNEAEDESGVVQCRGSLPLASPAYSQLPDPAAPPLPRR